MLRLLMIGIVLLSVCAVASSAQDRERLICPSPRVNAPSEILRPGETAPFTVTFDSNKPASNFLKYNWQLSSGRIISGQGTETIEVEPKIHYVRATVRVTGFRGDNDCAHPVEETVRWDVRPGAEKVRVFMTIDGRTAVPLAGNDHRRVIFLGLQKNTSEETARQRETQILEKLDENVDRNQTTIVRVYGGVDIIEYWSVSPEAEKPKCEGCEPPIVETNQECPTISITGPAGITVPGDNMIFRGSVTGVIPETVRYKWTVADGQIFSGQGTLNLTVTTPKKSSFTTFATFEVEGLPKGCPSIALEYAPVTCLCVAILVDEFAGRRDRIDTERLSKFANEVLENRPSIGHIIEYFAADVSRRGIDRKLELISEYLIRTKKLARTDFTIVISQDKKDRTKLYRIPPGAATPTP